MRGDIKGRKGEREVCQMLTNWWAPHYPNAVFVRTPGSGGWGGGSRFHKAVKSDLRASGDVMTTLVEFPFSVEVKRNESWSPDRLLAGRPSPAWTWWIQAQRQALNDGLIPTLWFRKNRTPWFVMVERQYAQVTLGAPYAVWSDFQLRGIDCGTCMPVLYRAEDLLTVDPRTLVRA